MYIGFKYQAAKKGGITLGVVIGKCGISTFVGERGLHYTGSPSQ